MYNRNHQTFFFELLRVRFGAAAPTAPSAAADIAAAAPVTVAAAAPQEKQNLAVLLGACFTPQ